MLLKMSIWCLSVETRAKDPSPESDNGVSRTTEAYFLSSSLAIFKGHPIGL